jgi:hypothetical protein
MWRQAFVRCNSRGHHFAGRRCPADGYSNSISELLYRVVPDLQARNELTFEALTRAGVPEGHSNTS